MTDRLSVVILAGGSSRRFSGDKLRARLDGATILNRVFSRVSPMASRVIIATSSRARGRELAQVLTSPAEFFYDRTARWGEGPAAAMASARERVERGPILFVPGDVPWIETEALRRLVAAASHSRADAAVPVWQGGETEHLIQWQRNPGVLSSLPWEPRVCPGFSWRASEFLRAVPSTLLVPVRTLTDDPGSLSHVTVPLDLIRPAPRGRIDSKGRSRLVEGSPKRCYRTAHFAGKTGDALRAAHAFREEGRWYARAGLTLLARHARQDANLGGRETRSVEQPERAHGKALPEYRTELIRDSLRNEVGVL